MSNLETGLPDGAEDFIGADAEELERIRNYLLSKFKRHGCQLVMPSLIEFSESLGGKMNASLKDFAYSFSGGKDALKTFFDTVNIKANSM